ncbi:MAG: hypothetical protein ACXWAT_13265 [Methylobacter sp.]
MKPKNSILLTVTYSAFLLIPVMAIADTEPETFKADKERQTAVVLEKVQSAQKSLSCVQEARDQAALKICEEDFKQKFSVPVPETKEQQPCQCPPKKARKGAKTREKQ